MAALALAVHTATRDDGRTIRAEFTNVRGLLVGNDVRIAGAKAGRIKSIRLTAQNAALVTMSLDDGAPPVRADAVAAIRPVDLLGDIYLSLSPGHSAAPLTEAIPVARTSNAPRISDVLGAFRAPVRTGLQAVIVELGLGLERRGDDVSRAAVSLRPALEATTRLLNEVDTQTADIRGLVRDAGSMSHQLATQNRALRASINGLAGTLTPIADSGPALPGALRAAPDLLGRLERTSGLLSRTALRGRPLAIELGRAAAPLTAFLNQAPPFLRDARSTLVATRPTLRSLESVLSGGRSTVRRLASGLRRTAAAAPATADLVQAIVPAAADISDGFLRNFPDQAKEPGNQPFDPFASPDRHYWKGAAVLSCQSFGLPITPGCIDKVGGQTHRKTPPSAHRPPPKTSALLTPPTSGADQAPGPANQSVHGTVKKALTPVQQLLGSILPGRPTPPAPPPPSTGGAAGLLDYLLGP
ncbi:MlaD family protein [Paraconexibacter antarcticus]|uniref:MlaD family protein n=1 Tax=Paraconexibacter antarcticus TaxID=2949664 RepID=A0ABY5E200_9ACTN|nr:MlaD family protein [Paraconexibacter antarcticus]UTI66864.1 MlaD family protein [Paraconexibacter antarcticus]